VDSGRGQEKQNKEAEGKQIESGPGQKQKSAMKKITSPVRQLESRQKHKENRGGRKLPREGEKMSDCAQRNRLPARGEDQDVANRNEADERGSARESSQKKRRMSKIGRSLMKKKKKRKKSEGTIRGVTRKEIHAR